MDYLENYLPDDITLYINMLTCYEVVEDYHYVLFCNESIDDL